MIGAGARGYIFDPAGLSVGLGVEIPWETVGRVPIIAVTGTNGKTTTVRLITHILASTGLVVGHTDTDGIYVGVEQIEEGDWAGFGGARQILINPAVEVAVLETSRGGILRRGLAFDETDVSVFTNVSADHLGELGITTVEELARVKGVVAIVAKPDGHVVLNADDPLVWQLAEYVAAPVIAFTLHPNSAVVAAHRAAGGAVLSATATTVSVSFGATTGDFPLSAVPITLDGAATHNVANVLAATAACLALGIPLDTIIAALATFGTDPSQNLGRLNLFERNGIQIFLDYAHNAAGWQALLDVGTRQCQRSGGRLFVLLGGPGDRSDAQIAEQGAMVGAVAHALLIHEEDRYRRGREPGEVPQLYAAGAASAGLDPARIAAYPDEVSSLAALLPQLQPGDVVIGGVHVQRQQLIAQLEQWRRS